MARRNRERNSSDASIAIPDGIKLTAASEQQWNRLVIGLPLERGPRLLFVTLDSPMLRRPLALDLAKNLTQAGVAVEIIDLSQPLAQPLQEILRLAQERPKANAYFVLGLDRSLLSVDHSTAAFADLNFHRERIPQAARAPLVFWLDTLTFKSLALRAPDFMAWRAGEFHLVEDEGPMSEAIQRYRQHVIDRFSKLTLYSVTSDKPLAVDLEQVFVKLITKEQASLFPDRSDDEVLLMEQVRDDMLHWYTHTESVQDASLEAIASWKHEDWLKFRVAFWLSQEPKSNTVAGTRETVSFSEATARNRELSIIGAPGSGKTTALKYLALTFARRQAKERMDVDEDLLPIYVVLRDFNNFLPAFNEAPVSRKETAIQLVRYLDEFHRQYFPHLKLPPEFFKSALAARRCILLLDGLDEVADSSRRAWVALSVARCAAQFSGNRFVLTSRPRGYESGGRQLLSTRFAECTIEDFDDEQIKSYVKSWYLAVTLDLEGDTPTARDLAATRAQDLLRAVQNDRVRPLATNPLLLSILALIHQRGNRLPQRRVALYEECIEFLLGFWRQVQGGDAARELAEVGGLTRNEKRTLLEPVALWLHERGESGAEVTRPELEHRLADEFRRLFSETEIEAARRASEFVDIIVEHAGLLVEREAGIFAFSHLTFQEFLAARALSDRRDYLEVVRSHLHNAWWREVILLLVGYLSSPCTRRSREDTGAILKGIRDAGSPLEEVLHRDRLFAFRCLSDVEQLGVDEDVRRSLVADVLELYQRTNKVAFRRDVLELFAYAAPTPVGRILTSSLLVLAEDPEANVRGMAVQALGVIGGAAPSPEILARLLDFSRDTHESVRNSAAEALASVGRAANTPQVITRLVEMIQETSAPPLTAADALSKIVAAAASSSLLLRLVELIRAPREGTSVGAVHAIGRLGAEAAGPEVIERLLELTRDMVAEVRRHAVDALGRLGNAAGTSKVLGRLTELTQDPEPLVRDFVAQAFDDIGAALPRAEVLSSLFELSRDQAAIVRSSAAQALGRIGAAGLSHDVLGRLLEMSQDVNLEVRAEATDALGALAAKGQGQDILGRLIELTRDPEVQVRRHASLALGSAGVAEARGEVIPILIGLIQDSDFGVRRGAGYALGMLGVDDETSKVLATLVKLTRDHNAMIRDSAVYALGRIGTAAATAQVLKRVVEVINDASKKVDLTASETLVRLGTSTATPGLLSRMLRLLRSSEDYRARANLAIALSQAHARLSKQQVKQLVSFWTDCLPINNAYWFDGSYRELSTVAYEQLKELAAVAFDARHKAVAGQLNLSNTPGTTADVSIAKKRSSRR